MLIFLPWQVMVFLLRIYGHLVVLHLILRACLPFMVLTPTSWVWHRLCHQLVSQSKIILLDAMDFKDVCVCTDSWPLKQIHSLISCKAFSHVEIMLFYTLCITGWGEPWVIHEEIRYCNSWRRDVRCGQCNSTKSAPE